MKAIHKTVYKNCCDVYRGTLIKEHETVEYDLEGVHGELVLSPHVVHKLELHGTRPPLNAR